MRDQRLEEYPRGVNAIVGISALTSALPGDPDASRLLHWSPTFAAGVPLEDVFSGFRPCPMGLWRTIGLVERTFGISTPSQELARPERIRLVSQRSPTRVESEPRAHAADFGSGKDGGAVM